MNETPELPVLSFPSEAEWEAWLMKNHSVCQGVWLRFFKKASGVKGLSYAEALDVSLCYGWIDSQLKKYDESSYIQRFTPRGPRSVWSKRNTEHVARLTSAGRMTQSGMEKVEAAKKDGRWDAAYASPANAVIPEDFKKALARNKKARAFFDSLNKANSYAFITRIQFARKPETRAKRISQFVEMLARGEKLH
jgi:uncharacterized protein YdeI (YjbR/CyaY-like superfamily)